MLDITRWNQIKEVFDGAIRLAQNERDDYLREACASDTELRGELNSLLAAFDEDTEFMETPALVGAADLIDGQLPDGNLGREVGRYLIMRRLGEGGMGVVYDAMRIDGQFEQRVAIKLIKRGMDSEHILRRFRNERQILAGLTHPNIAKLLDGGVTEDGSPYFVMEFIEGELIHSFCRAHSADTAKCVELVKQVCCAVEYAHGERIIHRDIKPGNILVDRQGTPKLLDFGIAKLMGSEGGEVTQRTMTELRIVTPDYASPEQIRGEPATERSDIYSLGVVLYELVAGKRFSSANNNADLPRDLQLIVDKATHIEAGRRYAGVKELTADLERFLLGESVIARPDGILYRVARKIRQHGMAVWAASLVLVAMAAASLSWFAQRTAGLISGGRHSVAVIEFQNITGAANAAWFSTALTEMLNAELSTGGKIRAIPGDSVARMKTDLSLQPAGSYSPAVLRRIAANLHPDYVIAGSYLASGDQSDMLVRVDLRLQDVRNGESLLAWTDTGTPAELPAIATRAGAKLRQVLGVASAGFSSGQKFTNPEGARFYAEGLERIRSFDALGARTRLERAVVENPADPLSHAALAVALGQLGYQARGAEEAKRALDLSGGLPRQRKLEVQARYYTMKWDWQDAAATYQTLWKEFPDNIDYGIGAANAQTKGGNVPGARQTLAQIRRNPAALLDPRVDLADALTADTEGESKQELELAQRAAAKARESGASQTLAECLYYEAWAKWLLGDLKGSEQDYAEAIGLFRGAGNQRRVVDMQNGLSAVLLDEGKTEESARLVEDGLAIARKLGDRSLEGALNNNLARCWERTGQLKKAQLAYEQSAHIDRELNDKANLAIGLVNVGGVMKDRGEFALARSTTMESLAIAREVGRKSTIAMALSNLADGSQALGDLAEAERFQAEALAMAREIGRKTSIASALRGQAEILRSQGRWPEAQTKYTEASQVATEGSAAEELAEIRMSNAQLLMDENQLDGAAKMARQALSEFQKEKSEEGQAQAEAFLSQIASRQEKTTDAEQLALSARQHLGNSEDLGTELAVKTAEALAAARLHKDGSALEILRGLTAEAGQKGMQETAWELELRMAEIEHTERAKKKVSEIRREATKKGILRIAQLKTAF